MTEGINVDCSLKMEIRHVLYVCLPSFSFPSQGIGLKNLIYIPHWFNQTADKHHGKTQIRQKFPPHPPLICSQHLPVSTPWGTGILAEWEKNHSVFESIHVSIDIIPNPEE